jgi:hypothetical protein
LLGLKGGAHGVGAGGGVVGPYGDLFCRAMALALMVVTILHVTGNAVVDMTATTLLILHFHLLSLLSWEYYT